MGALRREYADLAALVADGLTAREIAEAKGASIRKMREALERRGLRSTPHLKTWEHHIQDMTKDEAIAYLSELVRIHEGVHPLVRPDRPFEVDRQQELILNQLERSAPDPVASDFLMQIMYADHEDGGPLWARNVLGGRIAELRQKMPESYGRIYTVARYGYGLIKASK